MSNVNEKIRNLEKRMQGDDGGGVSGTTNTNFNSRPRVSHGGNDNLSGNYNSPLPSSNQNENGKQGSSIYNNNDNGDHENRKNNKRPAPCNTSQHFSPFGGDHTNTNHSGSLTKVSPLRPSTLKKRPSHSSSCSATLVDGSKVNGFEVLLQANQSDQASIDFNVHSSQDGFHNKGDGKNNKDNYHKDHLSKEDKSNKVQKTEHSTSGSGDSKSQENGALAPVPDESSRTAAAKGTKMLSAFGFTTNNVTTNNITLNNTNVHKTSKGGKEKDDTTKEVLFSDTSNSNHNTNSNHAFNTTSNSNKFNKNDRNESEALRKRNEALAEKNAQMESKLHRKENELRDERRNKETLETRNISLIKTLERTHREMARKEARAKRDRIALDCVRLGKIVTMRTSPTQYGEGWEEGYALKELNIRREEVVKKKEELTKRKNALANSKRKAKRNNTIKGDSSSSNLGKDDNDSAIVDLDFVAETEAVKCHMNALHNEEKALDEEKKVLSAEKAAHLKELKRCQAEDRSKFYKELPCLTSTSSNASYLLISLLGKGGFSEVWKALDLLKLREVAIKIHQLNPNWNEDRKASYMRHVSREYSIHKDMNHPRVVQLYDVFEIDSTSFATVLEYCRGIDLDERLKRNNSLVEKDAKAVLLQIASGLRYLNSPPDNDPNGGDDNDKEKVDNNNSVRTIIHYDLKPANILFDENGDAKITDFGLSKIIYDNADDDDSMELTSQGAGTYWYLPPECFERGNNGHGPRISSKVDVWSVGVIFYQMLYGKRPFGEGKSQESVLRENIMLHARQVHFPTEPKVSDEAKEFISKCLYSFFVTLL